MSHFELNNYQRMMMRLPNGGYPNQSSASIPNPQDPNNPHSFERFYETATEAQRNGNANTQTNNELRSFFPFLKSSDSIVINISLDFPPTNPFPAQVPLFMDPQQFEFFGQQMPFYSGSMPPMDHYQDSQGNITGDSPELINLFANVPKNNLEIPVPPQSNDLKHFIPETSINQPKFASLENINQGKIVEPVIFQLQINRNEVLPVPINLQPPVIQKNNALMQRIHTSDKNEIQFNSKQTASLIDLQRVYAQKIVQLKKKTHFRKPFIVQTGKKAMLTLKRVQKRKQNELAHRVPPLMKFFFKTEPNAQSSIPKNLENVLIPIFSFNTTVDEEEKTPFMENKKMMPRFITVSQNTYKENTESDLNKILKVNARRLQLYWNKKSLNLPVSWKRKYPKRTKGKGGLCHYEITDYSGKVIQNGLFSMEGSRKLKGQEDNDESD